MGIFPTWGSNPGLLHCRQTLDRLSHQGSPWSFQSCWKVAPDSSLTFTAWIKAWHESYIFKVTVTPWSTGWIGNIVFCGRRTTVTFGWVIHEWGTARSTAEQQSSVAQGVLKDKVVEKQILKMAHVTPALGWLFHTTGKEPLAVFRAPRFSEW